MLSDFLQDVRYGLRMLADRPGFTIAAVLILALGIGANTAVFTFMNSLFLRPLAVPDPERVVRLYGSGQDVRRFDAFSYANYRDLRDRSRSFEALAAHGYSAAGLSLGGDTENAYGELVTGNYFSAMKVQPVLGRVLTPEDDQKPGGHPVVVISHEMWLRRFGSVPDILGRIIYLNGHAFTVVGVMPERFKGSYGALAAEFWAPMMMYEQLRPRGLPIDQRGWGWLSGTGRLKAGVTIEQANRELAQLSKQLEQEYPGPNRNLVFQLYAAKALPASFHEGASRILAFFMAVVALVLLVACANVAALLLARVVSREREIAIRQSLGASRSRLVRQWLAETLVLSLLGGCAGLVVAGWANRGALFLVPPALGEFSPETGLDWRVLVFASGVMLLTSMVIGIAPAMRAGRTDLAESLKQQGTASQGAGRNRLHAVLVAVQVTASLVLLVVAGLLLRSLRESEMFNPGFRSDKLLLTCLDVSLRRHGFNEERAAAFCKELAGRLQSLPGVESVTWATVVPLGGSRESNSYRIEGHEPPAGRQAFSISSNAVGPGYFSTMGIPIIEGRPLDERDDAPNAKPVIVINETMARRFWPGQSAVGKVIQSGTNGPMLEIVGVARDIKYYTLAEDPRPYVYKPLGQSYLSNLTAHLRTAGNPANLKPAVQRVVENLDRRMASHGTITLSELRRVPLFPGRAMATISTLFCLITLVFTAVGLYGVVSYSVSRRTREIGIRMALGAQPRGIVRLMLTVGILPTATGVIAGIAA